ncbi:MAG: hypothetical protein IPN54_10260 [Bacteroidetes bacterium]|nr:hypothetical protein [Bacteroidota bacterium]
MKIMLSGIFEDKPIFRKILILGGISAISSIILLMTGAVIVRFVYGIDVLGDANALSDLSDKTVMNAMRILQVFSTGLGMFLIPALLAALVFDKKTGNLFNGRPHAGIANNSVDGCLSICLDAFDQYDLCFKSAIDFA